MNEKSISNQSGLYGESIYPPMFDSEPPPLDDEDGDPNDDDFADFTSFQKTGSDSNNWGSWSNWSGDSEMPEKVGEFDGGLDQKPLGVVGEGSNEFHRPEPKSSAIQLDSKAEFSQFESFSKTSSSDLVFSGKFGQKSSEVSGNLSKGTDQFDGKMENQSVEMPTFNGNEALEDSSNLNVMNNDNCLAEEKSHPSPDVVTAAFDNNTKISVSNNGICNDVTQQERLNEKVANLERENDEFEDFADFKASAKRDGFFASSFDEMEDCDKSNSLNFFTGSNMKLKNEPVEAHNEFDLTENVCLDASDINKTSDAFAADFPHTNDDLIKCNYIFTANRELGESRDIEKMEIQAVNSTKSDAIAYNVHKSFQEENVSQCEDKSHRDLSNDFKNMESFSSHPPSALGNNSLNETVTKIEKKNSEDIIDNQSLSLGGDFPSNLEKDAVDHEIFGTNNGTNVNNSDNFRKDNKVMNSFEIQADYGKGSNMEGKFLSPGSSATLQQNDVNIGGDFDDFQGTKPSENISENKEKSAVNDNKNFEDKETDSLAMTGVHGSNDVQMSGKLSKAQTGTSNLDDFTDRESFVQQNHNEIDFQKRDEFEGFQKNMGPDLLVYKLESSAEVTAAETQSYIHDSCSGTKEKLDNCIDELENFEGFAHSAELFNDHESSMEVTNAKGSFLDSDTESENSLNIHNDEFNDFKNYSTSVQSVGSANQQQNVTNSVGSTGQDVDSIGSPVNMSNEKIDEFDDFQNFSTAIGNSFQKDAEDESKVNAGPGWGSYTESDKDGSDEDKWASFSSADQVAHSNKSTDNAFGNFAAFPVDEQQNNDGDDDDDNWASFSSPQPDSSSQNSSSVTEKKFASGNEFGNASAKLGVLETKPLGAKVMDSAQQQIPQESLIPILLAPCFATRSRKRLEAVGLVQFSNIEKLLHDERNQEACGVWSRLSNSEVLEEAWKLSYTSSINFKWLLQSVNVAFEKIMKKHTHSSKDTLSSLSPASSVASFDMEAFGEQILVPEPATKFSSLLKPTLLAQSQQKELDLQNVPPVSYLKKGDSGSDPTSETNSLDLDFFSGGSPVAPVTMNSAGSSSSLSNIGVHDFEISPDSPAMKADTQDKKQPYLPPRSGKGSTSLPFNLGSMSNAVGKEDISKEARRFLEDVESLRFMSSTVLMFPSQFSSSE